MAVPERIKVTGYTQAAFGHVFGESDYLTIGKEYDVVDEAEQFGAINDEKGVAIMADNDHAVYILLQGRCAHGYTYEVVA